MVDPAELQSVTKLLSHMLMPRWPDWMDGSTNMSNFWLFIPYHAKITRADYPVGSGAMLMAEMPELEPYMSAETLDAMLEVIWGNTNSDWCLVSLFFAANPLIDSVENFSEFTEVDSEEMGGFGSHLSDMMFWLFNPMAIEILEQISLNNVPAQINAVVKNHKKLISRRYEILYSRPTVPDFEKYGQSKLGLELDFFPRFMYFLRDYAREEDYVFIDFLIKEYDLVEMNEPSNTIRDKIRDDFMKIEYSDRGFDVFRSTYYSAIDMISNIKVFEASGGRTSAVALLFQKESLPDIFYRMVKYIARISGNRNPSFIEIEAGVLALMRAFESKFGLNISMPHVMENVL